MSLSLQNVSPVCYTFTPQLCVPDSRRHKAECGPCSQCRLPPSWDSRVSTQYPAPSPSPGWTFLPVFFSPLGFGSPTTSVSMPLGSRSLNTGCNTSSLSRDCWEQLWFCTHTRQPIQKVSFSLTKKKKKQEKKKKKKKKQFHKNSMWHYPLVF